MRIESLQPEGLAKRSKQPSQFLEEKAMRVDGTEFGSIAIDGKTYQFDVVVRLSCEVVKRKKKLSKKYYGTSHTISKEEAKFVYEDGCEELVIGTGHHDNVRLSKEAAEYFDKKGCKVIAQPSPHAIGTFNKSRKAKVGLFHVTC